MDFDELFSRRRNRLGIQNDVVSERYQEGTKNPEKKDEKHKNKDKSHEI